MRWSLKPKPNSENVTHLQQVLTVSKSIAQLLVQRNINNYEEAKHFFRPNLNQLHDPYLMKDMNLAVARIITAIETHQNIMVYGDYDVDGTTSVALMSSYLKSLYPNVTTYIPDRYAEGYGVSFKGIDFAHDNDIHLIIALDCGIKAIDKVAYAKEKGIDFIICDHHRPGHEIPKAVAVLDPKRTDCEYPYKELCGCGVGFKLIQAIHQHLKLNFNTIIPYLDLVATAIGADIVPITGENRTLAFYGLQIINQQPRPGFKALIAQTKKQNLSITDVVFMIAPRINAAGRMKHGLHAVDLLSETDYPTAVNYAKAIELYNTNRKDADKKITQEALLQIEENKETEQFSTVVYQPHWHKGVIGIVASRLTETYYRPTLVFTKSGNKLAASARSVIGYDVYNALEASSQFIEQFGGHKYAAGLTLTEENYPKFKAKFEEVVKKQIDPKLLSPVIEIDQILCFDQIDARFYRILKQFAPFGPLNRAPIFMTKNVVDTGYAKTVGADNKHLKCHFKCLQKGIQFAGIGFNLGQKLDLLKNQTPVHIAYTLDENEWNGTVSLQLRIKDIKVG
ncbi:single-stranded-DNA-specific exonuclease RecJ [Aquimarina agarivorans]|uniref:single-stranded-DNA-specific exonuclease RecJ n=1 Tax=Aquimarina agarivorans TaxID=980584 RepID=UPI000248E632|nr:single-stranded-DNA-specific exonuclease RecJ [Aquimarina agarivorans]